MRQFRVLYREFLFRMVDLEMLSSRGDIQKLLGQVAALLATISVMFSGSARRYADSPLSTPALIVSSWTEIHFLISTTMLVAGLFTVLCWDSIFPDRRDVLVLSPLPVRARTLFLAKAAALGTALGLAVLTINIFTGLAHPITLGLRVGGLLGALRTFVAYWITMYAAGAFLVCAVLGLQGLAAQFLSRARFLKVSGYLQLAAFALVLTVYFLEPMLTTPQALASPFNQTYLALLPPYWFLGLFERLCGTSHPVLAPLERRALVGLAMVFGTALLTYALCYFRTLRKIVEEADIVPGVHAAGWSPRCGNSLTSSVVLFSARTLMRSRQHRVILAGYLGVGLSIALAYCSGLFYRVNHRLPMASFVVMAFAVIGTRAVFALPLELRANWIFQLTAIRSTPQYLAAIRRSLLVLAVAPVWILSTAVFLSLWPWPVALGHLTLLGIFGVVVADMWLHQFQKIPFTCSYMPGKANIHVTSLAYLIVFVTVAELVVRIELIALQTVPGFCKMLFVFCLVALWARRRTGGLSRSSETQLQFEDTEKQDITALQLHCDGKLILDEAR